VLVIVLSGNSTPKANAQAQIVGGSNTFINPQSGTITSGNNLVFPQAASVASCNTQLNGIVTVNKVVSDPSNIASGSANTLPFTIVLTANGFPNTFTLTASSSAATFCIPTGQTVSVTETVLPTQFSFSSPTFSSGCNSTVQAGQTINCTVTNTITGTGTGTGVTPQSATVPATPTVSIPNINPQAAVTPDVAAKANPPFQTCMMNVQIGQGGTNNVANQIPSAAGATVIRAPSSSTITVEGTVSLDRVKNAMQSLNTNTFTMQLLQDLNPADQIRTAIASPFLTGRIIVTSDDGVKQKIINFNVQNARTECKFITLAKAAQSAPNGNIVPLGRLRVNSPGHIELPDTNRVLAGIGPFVGPTTSATNGVPFPQAINPPFATCQAPQVSFVNGVPTVGDPANKDNLALYNIRGTLSDLNQLSGHRLVIEINSDIVQAEQDKAMLINNSNPLINVNLISDPGRSSVHQIRFTTNDLWTDCKSIDANSQEIFKEFPGEAPY